MSRTNRSAVIRRGLGYQDLCGFKLCLDLLKAPDEYSWIQFETAPDGTTGQFYLDDIVLLHKDGTHTLIQVKHREHPDTDPWTWNQLLSQDKDSAGKPKSSLIQKWALSINKEGLKLRLGKLITNGRADSELTEAIKDGKIDVVLLKATQVSTFDLLVKQLGSEASLRDFATKFAFLFSQPDIQPLEDQTRLALSKGFGATEAGIDHLLREIIEECQKKTTAPWDIQAIISKCEFANPRHLNEEFTVPSDFQVFDQEAHAAALGLIKAIRGGVQVFCGSPGSGKSTYLAWLAKTLKASGVVVLRHHYHINPTDPKPLERISAKRVIEALKAQCRDQYDLLGPLAVQNADRVDLSDFLGQIAAASFKAGKTTVLIVDGLDHALRYEDSQQLKALLSEACVPQDGLWIFLGTQAVAKDHLPQIVFDKCAEASWIRIPGLTKEGVSEIVKTNQCGLKLPTEQWQLTALDNRIWALCAGNPLHLRYTISALALKRAAQVTEYDCQDLLAYDEDIAKYYDALWRKLPAVGKSLALCLVIAAFEPTEDQLCGLASVLKFRPDETSAGLASILHLLQRKAGRLKIFHNSFRQFLVDVEEFSQQKDALRLGLRDWLAASGFVDLKWAHLRILNYQLGDPASLLEIDRDWIVDAIAWPRPYHQIDEQLKLAAEAAFKSKKFGACLKFSMLRQYVANVTDASRSPEYVDAWNLAYRLRPSSEFDIQLGAFTPKQLVALSQVAYRAGRFAEIEDDAISALNDHHNDLRHRAQGEIGGTIPEVARAAIDIIICDEAYETEKLIEYLRNYSSSGWGPALVGCLAQKLIALGRLPALVALSKYTLTPEERYEFLRVCAKAAFRTGEKAIDGVFDTADRTRLHPLANLYCELTGRPVGIGPILTPHTALPDLVPEYDSGHRDNRANSLSEGFILGIVCGLSGKEAIVDKWNAEAEDTWSHQAYSTLLSEGVVIGHQLKAETPLDVASPAKAADTIPVLNWPRDRERLEYEHSLRLAIRKMCGVMLALIRFQGRKGALSGAEVNAYRESKHFGSRLFIDLLDHRGEALLESGELDGVIADEIDTIRRSQDSFSERASEALKLARLARTHNDEKRAGELLKVACNYLISYGGHKDPFLDRVMDSIRIAHRGRPANTKRYLDRVAPLALGIREYTDGDDTRYFPEYLADLLADTLQEYLPGYFIDQAGREDYYLAERVFSSLIRAISLKLPENQGVAATALDRDSHQELKKRAAAAEAEASTVLASIQHQFGGFHFESQSEGSSGLPTFTEAELAAVAIPDIDAKLGNLDHWHRARFLSRWVQVQRRLKPGAEEELLSIIERFVDQKAMSQVDSETLDAAFELALPCDREKAFQYVTWAQANAVGWEPFFSSAEGARSRWKFVQDNFPDRYLEFFELSIERSGRRYRQETSYFIAAPRSIEFFAMFGQWDWVEDITSAAVDLVCSLIIDTVSATCPWLNDPPIGGLPVLLRRLTWPSPLVRERAASSLTDLLLDASTAGTTKQGLLDWIAAQKLESLAILGLLPFAKAAPLLPGGSASFTSAELAGTVNANSIVIQMVIEYIAKHLGETYARNPVTPASTRAAGGYSPGKFFGETISSFLPPAYLMRAQKVQRQARDQFVADWASTAESLAASIGLEQDSSVLEFMGRQDDPHLVAMSTRQSEVFRSAFLRCLTDYFNAGKLNEEVFLDYALDTLPIDLSLWRVHPNRRPSWWPNGKIEGLSREAVVGLSYEDELGRITAQDREPKILAAGGRVTDAPDSAVAAEMRIIGFGYRILGTKLPSAEQVWDYLARLPCELTPPPILSLPIAHLESGANHLPSALKSETIEQAEITSLCGSYAFSSMPSWQWFRFYYGAPYGLSKHEFPAQEIRLGSDRWSFSEAGREIGAASDWTDGVLDRERQGMPPPCGHYLQVEGSYLDSFLRRTGLRLGYVVQLRVRVKEESFGKKPKEYESVRLRNISPIITPLG